MAKETKLVDFGQKIGGARKDVWKSRGLSLDDLFELTDSEAKKYVTKENVWPKPDWVTKISKEKSDKAVCYWQNEIRKSLPPNTSSMTGEQKEDRYVEIVGQIRDAVMGVKTPKEAEEFYKNHILGKFVTPETGRYVHVQDRAKGIITNKFLKAITFAGELYYKRKSEYITFGVPKQDKEYAIRKNQLSACCYDKKQVFFEKFDRKGTMRLTIKYGYSSVYFYPKEVEEYSWTWKQDSWFVVNTATRQIEAYNLSSKESAMQKIEELASKPQNIDEAADEKRRAPAKKQKKSFQLTKLDKFTRSGKPILQSEENVSPERFMDTFQVRGGEFGNWLSNEERQRHLNLTYEAFYDLATALGIKPSDITFGGKLSIAFGSRGRGGQSAASAHFEPLLEVINLTKIHGAGCLAHEWGHAMDHFMAVSAGDSAVQATESYDVYNSNAYPPALKELLKNMIRHEDGTLTDFYLGSCKFDKLYRKSGHGYWSDQCEMFARAFDCYIKDKMTKCSCHNDYLTSNADSFIYTMDDGTIIYAYPRGQERETLNKLFDRLIKEIWSETN